MILTDDNIRSYVKQYLKDDTSFEIKMEDWDVSNVKDMSELFKGYKKFNKKLKWNVSNVTTMLGMFAGCKKFNQPLEWNVSKVTNMIGMFDGCEEFNQPLKWDVSKVTSMAHMFEGCKKFNQPLKWDVSKVNDMSHMFWKCEKFNRPLEWNVSNVNDMMGMFAKCKTFNQPLEWTLNAIDLRSMFYECEEFNQPLKWDVSKVKKMDQMFEGCKSFNQDLSHWKAISTYVNMFKNCNLPSKKYPSFIKPKRCSPGTRKNKSGKCESIRDTLNARLKACLEKQNKINPHDRDYVKYRKTQKRCDNIKDKIGLLDKDSILTEYEFSLLLKDIPMINEDQVLKNKLKTHKFDPKYTETFTGKKSTSLYRQVKDIAWTYFKYRVLLI